MTFEQWLEPFIDEPETCFDCGLVIKTEGGIECPDCGLPVEGNDA